MGAYVVGACGKVCLGARGWKLLGAKVPGRRVTGIAGGGVWATILYILSSRRDSDPGGSFGKWGVFVKMGHVEAANNRGR